jgi:hypothetical protein
MSCNVLRVIYIVPNGLDRAQTPNVPVACVCLYIHNFSGLHIELITTIRIGVSANIVRFFFFEVRDHKHELCINFRRISETNIQKRCKVIELRRRVAY